MARRLTTRRTVLGNSLVLIAAEGATRATSFLTIAYLSRTLLPGGMGAVEFGFAVFALFQAVGSGGVEALLTPAAARRPDDVPTLAGRSLLLAGSQLVVAAIVLGAGGAMLDLSAELRASALLFAAAALIVPAGMRFAFVAGERAWVLGLTNVVGHVCFLGLCLAGVHKPEDVVRVGLFWVAAIALRTVVALVAFVRRYGAVVFATDRFLWWLGRTAAVGLGSLSLGLMTSADVVVLGLMRAPEEVACYGLAAKLPLFLASLVGLFYTALFPTLVRAVAGNDDARVARIGSDAIALGLGIAVPGALALGLVAEPLITLLFTDRFRSAAPVLALLAWRFPLSATVGILQSVLWAQSPEREARVAVTVFLATLALLPFGAQHAGAIGVGWCMLLGNLLAIALFARATGVRDLLGIRTVAIVTIGAGATVGLLRALAPIAGPAAIAAMLVAWAAGSAIATFPVLTRLARPPR